VFGDLVGEFYSVREDAWTRLPDPPVDIVNGSCCALGDSVFIATKVTGNLIGWD
jgi:hypothetical protein